MKKRLPFFAFVLLGVVLWRGGFGFLATERTLTWRFPVSYGDVRRLELQVWDGEALLRRQELAVPGGLASEPTCAVPLSRGVHRAIGSLWFADGGTQNYQQDFDPGALERVVIAFGP